jgi:hypothetical protein
MTFTPTMWSILETAREKPRILLRPGQIGAARLLEKIPFGFWGIRCFGLTRN